MIWPLAKTLLQEICPCGGNKLEQPANKTAAKHILPDSAPLPFFFVRRVSGPVYCCI